MTRWGEKGCHRLCWLRKRQGMDGWQRKWRAMKLIAKFFPFPRRFHKKPAPLSELKSQLLELGTQVGVVKGQSGVHRQNSQRSQPNQRPLTLLKCSGGGGGGVYIYVCQPCRSHIKWVYVLAPQKAPEHALKLLSCMSIKVVYGQVYPEDVFQENGVSSFGLWEILTLQHITPTNMGCNKED